MTADMTALLLFHPHREHLRVSLTRKGVSPQDIDDVLQEVFVRFTLKVDTGAEIGEPAAYLFGIAHHVLADYHRQRFRGAADSRYARVEDECLGSRAAEDAAESLKLLEAIDALGPVDKAVFVLWYRQGLRHKEIGRELDLSHHTVRKYLSRAKEQLKQMCESGSSGIKRR